MAPHTDEARRPQTVLVVDDDARDRTYLRDALERDGYLVVEASDGREALEKARKEPFDAILLNVMMPAMDGIQVCRELVGDPRTAAIPVILVTSQRRREVRLEGIAAGARDFLLKPVDLADLRVRVRNAGQMKRMYDESEERFRKISALESLRDSLVHMMVHDLRTPLTSVVANLQLLDMTLGEEMDRETREILDGCLSGAGAIRRMVDSMLDVSKLESGTMDLNLQPTLLSQAAEAARASLGPQASRVVLAAPPSPEADRVRCDPDIVQRVIVNLLTNALDYSPAEDAVLVRIAQVDGGVRVSVEDRGAGVPEEYRDRIFEKFGQASGTRRIRKGSVGLGLAFAKLAVEAHGGRIDVQDNPEGGSIFWFSLPLTPPGEAATPSSP